MGAHAVNTGYASYRKRPGNHFKAVKDYIFVDLMFGLGAVLRLHSLRGVRGRPRPVNVCGFKSDLPRLHGIAPDCTRYNEFY